MENSTFNEWAVVTLFYSSVHYTDAVLSLDTSLSEELRDPENHSSRKYAISQCKDLLPIARHYFELDDRSRDARYSRTCFKEEFQKSIKKELFEPIQNHVRTHLGISLESEP